MAGDKHIPNTQWNEDRPRQVYEMALLGLTEKQMARVMGLHEKTLEYWKTDVNKGGMDSDSEERKLTIWKWQKFLHGNCPDPMESRRGAYIKGRPN